MLVECIPFLPGAILFENAQKVNWTDVRESVPIFLVTALVPFTYSLFYGVLCGLCMHLVFKVCSGNFWRRHSPPWLLSIASRCYSCLSGKGCQRTTHEDSSLQEHLRDEFGLPNDDRYDDDNRTEPLFFDNPYFDFQTPSAPNDVHSDDGSEFFGVSLRGIGMNTLSHEHGRSSGDLEYANIEGADYNEQEDADLDEDDRWYRAVPMNS